MKKSVKKKWLKALKSGEYKPAEGSLEREGRHCCLGVLADLAVKAGVVSSIDEAKHRDGDSSFDGDEFLGEKVCVWAGLSGYNGVGDVSDQTRLATKNDAAFSWDSAGKTMNSPDSYPDEVIDYITNEL